MQVKVQQYLSSPIQILWFEADDVGIIFFCFTVAMVFGGLFWILFFAGPYMYGNCKKKYPKSFLKHMLYFSGLKKIKGYPDSFANDFHE
jgi:hypothetical protein